MGREIDLTQPLSAEDRAWLEERGKYGDLRIANEYNAPQPEGEDAEVSESGTAYDDWTKAQLQYEAHARDLSTTGTKADLVERLLAYDAEHPDEDDDGSDDSGDGDDEA